MSDPRSFPRAAVFLLALASMLLVGAPVPPVDAAPAPAGGRFVTTWTGGTATLCLYGDVDVTIDWGDGTALQTVSGNRDRASVAPITHTFAGSASSRQVTTTGTFERLGCQQGTGALLELRSVDEWGETGTTDLFSAFRGTIQLQAVAEPPHTVTDMSQMFLASRFNQPIGHWDTSGVTDMTRMFSYSEFNQPLGVWDTSQVTGMLGMFEGSPFNRPVGNWDIGQVTDLSWMFAATPFNQPVGNWNTSNVTNMKGVFSGTPFDQPVGGWDTARVTDMGAMFNDAPFSQPIGNWDTSNVTNMAAMFRNTTFDQPIGNWDTSNVTNMAAMFQNSSFDQPIGNWDTSQVTDMSWMFSGSSFDQPIGGWDTANVVDMSWMFESTPFNQSISNWDTANVVGMDDMFRNAASFNQDLASWCVPRIGAEPVGFDSGALAWTLPRPQWGTCGGVDTTGPAVRITSATSTDQVRVRGTATDPSGVARVLGAIMDRATGKWLRRDRTWGDYQRLPANLPDAGSTTSKWLLARRLPPGSYTIKIIAFDVPGHINPSPRPFRIVQVLP
jgi:surface protein